MFGDNLEFSLLKMIKEWKIDQDVLDNNENVPEQK